MPFISFKILSGRTIEQKKKLVKEVTEVVCRNLNVTPDKVYIDINEYTLDGFAKEGKLYSDK